MSLLSLPRPRTKAVVRAKIDASALCVRVYALLIGLSLGFGVVVLMGKDDRLSGPSFSGARELVTWLPGPPWTVWGAFFVAYGVFLSWAMGRHKPAIHGLRVGTVAYFFLVACFVASVPGQPTVSLTGIVAYSILALVHAVISIHIEHRGWNG